MSIYKLNNKLELLKALRTKVNFADDAAPAENGATNDEIPAEEDRTEDQVSSFAKTASTYLRIKQSSNDFSFYPLKPI